MIRLACIFTIFALAAASAHFGYLRFAAAPAPARTPTSPPPELIWLQRELDLAPSQLAVVRALHEAGSTRVAGLRAQLEAERRNARVTGNPAVCVAAEAQCKSYTVNFIHQTTTVLTPVQRQKYLGLVGSCLPPPPRTEGVNVEQSPGR